MADGPDAVIEAVGPRLRTIRKQRGITLVKLAELTRSPAHITRSSGVGRNLRLRRMSTGLRARIAAGQCVGVAAFQVARTHGFAALPDLAHFDNPADRLGGRRGQLNGQAPSSRLEDLVAGASSATSTANDDRQTRASTPTSCAPASS